MKNEDKMAGVIYILTNPSFPDYVKIGYADDVCQRLKQLNRSECVPYAFRVYATYEVSQRLQDKELHALIDRINPELRTIDTFDGKRRVREFFAMSAEDAYALLESIAALSGTTKRLKLWKPEEHEILDEKTAEEIQEISNERRDNFSFSKCGISVGSVISLRNHPEITAVVKDDKNIEYEGQTCSLTKLARELLNLKGCKGPQKWLYNGKILDDIRTEREEQGLYC